MKEEFVGIIGKTKIFDTLAGPIKHVHSPEWFNPIFVVRGVDAIIMLLHFLLEDFEIGWQGSHLMRNPCGFVVRIPLKGMVFRFSDEIEESASTVAAANTGCMAYGLKHAQLGLP